MNRRIFSFLTVLGIAATTTAQITISDYDMPLAGDIYMYENTTDLLSEDFTLTGAAHAWDYSSATLNTNDTVYVVSVSSTPFAYQLYFNNQILYPDHKADHAIAGQDVSAGGFVTITERYDYYRINADSYEITGFGANVNGVPASVKYDTIDQLYPFPIAFGMATHTSSGYYLSTIPSLGTYGQWIRREVTSDGYGSLVTPYYTYPNTLRVKTVLYQTDTVYADQFMFGQTIDRPVETKYEWFTNTERLPVMSVTVTSGNNTNVKYLSPIAAGINEHLYDITVVPTAQEGVFQIVNNSGKQITNSYIFGVKGEQIEVQLKENNIIDITHLASGMYVLGLVMEGSDITTKKIVKQ